MQFDLKIAEQKEKCTEYSNKMKAIVPPDEIEALQKKIADNNEKITKLWDSILPIQKKIMMTTLRENILYGMGEEKDVRHYQLVGPDSALHFDSR